MTLVYFIVLVGVLIFVHEFGHFAWAKLFGVKVLKFSLGFGPRVAGFRRGETEYVIAAIPLGGYVRMLGENPHDEVADGEQVRAFHSQALWKRIIIVCAGPAMNLLFPVLLYFVVFLGNTELPPAVVGTVLPGRPADGKLQPGDRIVAVDGEAVATFNDLTRIVNPQPEQTLRFEVERDDERLHMDITPELVTRTKARVIDLKENVGQIGVSLAQPRAVVGVADPSGPAAEARLRTFDTVVSVDGKPTERWIDLERVLDANRGSTVKLTVFRPQAVGGALGELADLHVFHPRVVPLTPDTGDADGPARAGLERSALYVSYVAPDSPASEAGLEEGDRLLALDGAPLGTWREFQTRLLEHPERRHSLRVRRAGQLLDLSYKLQGVEEGVPAEWVDLAGLRNWDPALPHEPITNPDLLGYALTEAVEYTGEVLEATSVSLVRLLQGRLSSKTLGGPLAIFEGAGEAAREGVSYYLLFMGFISINLGLLNLLPIPVLDGGHLVFFMFELVARRPLSMRFREVASLVGLSMLILLMVFAFKNDIERQWPEFVQGVTGE